MDSAVHIIPQLTLQHFREMEALELQFYDAEFITPPEEAWSWYARHPHSAVAAAINGKLVGFVNLFPVKPTVYQALREGRFNDHFMVMDDVADITDTPLHMFLSCVVVAQEARPLGLTRKLLQAAAQPYANLPCVGVVTDNVTADGCRFSERYGFTRVCRSDHDSWVYEQSWEAFLAAIHHDGC